MTKFIHKRFEKRMRDSILFDKAVAQYFEPIARKHNLPLLKIRDGVFEIVSPHFIMRIRLHTGHARGLNVMLRSALLNDFDENKPDQQYGIGCFILFQGEELKQIMIDVNTDEDFLKQAKLLAEATERFGVPYLLGQKNDFETVREMIRKRGEPELEKIKQMMRNMPPFVRQEWHIPED